MDNKNENKKHDNNSLNKIKQKSEIIKQKENYKKQNFYSENNKYIYNKLSHRNNNNIIFVNNNKNNEKKYFIKNKKGIDEINKKEIIDKKLKKIKSKEFIPNLNIYIKFNDFHSNIVDGLKKLTKSNNQRINNYNYNKGKCINDINIKINQNDENNINKFRPYSNNNSRQKKLRNKINFNKDKKINSFHSKKNKKPCLINIDLTNIDEKEIKNNNKNFEVKNKYKAPSNNKNKNKNIRPSKTKFIPSININLNEINKEKELKNISNINNKNNDINNNIYVNNINKEKSNEIKKGLINNNYNLYKSYAFVENQNKECRESMEDFHDFKDLTFNNFYCFYFSIFDGHNGKEVSLYLKHNYYKLLLNELKKISFTNNWKLNNEKIISSIKSSFEKMDKNIIDNKNIKDDIGSTATIIFLYKDPFDNSKKIIVCANIGDSKGVLINKETINQITKSHICSDINEVERIKKKGGVVFRGRVFGSLMLTRSFGDKEMKKYGVISIPYCSSSLINENDLYIIIGSDGVWDTISNEDLFKFSKEKISSEDFAKKIVMLSIDRGTTDNVSCLVLKLN